MGRLWKINCSENRFPGMWQRWYLNQCAAVGWGGPYGFKLEGKTRGGKAWSTARNALLRMEVGDWVVVTLHGHRVGRLGQITGLPIGDNEWDPLVPKSSESELGEMGRRILLRWDLTCGPVDRDEVVLLPEDKRFTFGELRPSISEISSMTIRELREAMSDTSNWEGLLAFNYERSLSEFIAAYPHRLEDGLLPHPHEKVREKVFQDGRRLDVLLVDSTGKPVIVECKQNQPTVENIQQLRHYINRLQVETNQKARGILVHGGARKLRNDVRNEAKVKPIVELISYSVEVDFVASN